MAASLMEGIRAGRYEPGNPRPAEPERARLLGVSRHPVRAALRSLHERGPSVTRQEHGSVVQATAVEPCYSRACSAVEDRLQHAATRRVLDVRAEVEARYDAALQRDIREVEVWRANGGNDYGAASGRLVAQRPHDLDEYTARTARDAPYAYESGRAPAVASAG